MTSLGQLIPPIIPTHVGFSVSSASITSVILELLVSVRSGQFVDSALHKVQPGGHS